MKTKNYSSYTAHNYQYQLETAQASNELNEKTEGTVSAAAHNLGMNNAEPIIVMMDSLIRYAKAHNARYDGKLANDYILGDEWLTSIKAVKRLCDGDGAVAMEKGIATDSKDNGTIESLFWKALDIAGFSEKDI